MISGDLHDLRHSVRVVRLPVLRVFKEAHDRVFAWSQVNRVEDRRAGSQTTDTTKRLSRGRARHASLDVLREICRSLARHQLEEREFMRLSRRSHNLERVLAGSERCREIKFVI